MYMLAAGKPYVRFCVFWGFDVVWVDVGWGGVGWDNSIQLDLHTYVMLRYRPVLLHLHTYLMLRYRPVLLHMCFFCYACTLLHHLIRNTSCVFCYACTLLHHLIRNTSCVFFCYACTLLYHLLCNTCVFVFFHCCLRVVVLCGPASTIVFMFVWGQWWHQDFWYYIIFNFYGSFGGVGTYFW